MGGLPGKERTMRSHRRRGVAVRWQQVVSGDAFLRSGGSPAVLRISIVVLQIEKKRGR
jgi:hypothetical protein